MKKFEINGLKYHFSKSKFSLIFANYAKRHQISFSKLEELLSEEICIGQETVHSWRFGPGGPGELAIIVKLANFFEIKDYQYLLEEDIMIKLSDLQLQSVKRIYDACVNFLHKFNITGGFTTSMWYKLEENGSKDPEEDLYEYVDGLINEIELVILEEFFYLHSLPIYNELINYLNEDLYDVFDGKLSYGYRVEAIPEGNPTTEDDYLKAMNKLNSIIEKYN